MNYRVPHPPIIPFIKNPHEQGTQYTNSNSNDLEPIFSLTTVLNHQFELHNLVTTDPTIRFIFLFHREKKNPFMTRTQSPDLIPISCLLYSPVFTMSMSISPVRFPATITKVQPSHWIKQCQPNNLDSLSGYLKLEFQNNSLPSIQRRKEKKKCKSFSPDVISASNKIHIDYHWIFFWECAGSGPTENPLRS